MKPIETARDVAARLTRALWAWQQPAPSASLAPSSFGGAADSGYNGESGSRTGMGVTPAQDLGFFARSAAWRCASCGKLHQFAEQVPVIFATPCVCAGIEFEPQRDGAFDALAFADTASPALLT